MEFGKTEVMPHLPAAEAGTAQSAERPTYRLHPAPAEGETPSGLPARRQRYIDGNTELHLAIKRQTPMERQPTTASF